MKKRITALLLALLFLFSGTFTVLAEDAEVGGTEETSVTENAAAEDTETEYKAEENTETEEQSAETPDASSDKKEEESPEDETEPSEEEKVREQTVISGIGTIKTIKASGTMTDKIGISPADFRVLEIQMYSSKDKKWVTKKKIQLENEGRQVLTVTYPDQWKKLNVSKWRFYLPESENALSFTGPVTTIKTANRTELKLSAKSVIIMRAGNGDILYSKGIYKKRAIASTTKLMTATVALEKKKLKSKFKISKKAAKTPYSMDLEKGDVFRFKALLYAALIPSDNASATAIAENTAGSVKKFSALMNKKAASLGCKNTHFSNPNGLSAKNNYSTAYDLALITRNAMKKKAIVKTLKKKKVTIKSLKEKKKYKLSNSNILLGTEGLVGAKTGWTSRAGGCYAGEYIYKGKKYVIVVLGSKSVISRFTDARKLIKYIKKYGD